MNFKAKRSPTPYFNAAMLGGRTLGMGVALQKSSESLLRTLKISMKNRMNGCTGFK